MLETLPSGTALYNIAVLITFSNVYLKGDSSTVGSAMDVNEHGIILNVLFRNCDKILRDDPEV